MDVEEDEALVMMGLWWRRCEYLVSIVSASVAVNYVIESRCMYIGKVEVFGGFLVVGEDVIYV